MPPAGSHALAQRPTTARRGAPRRLATRLEQGAPDRMKKSLLLGSPEAHVDNAAFAEALCKLRERFALIEAAEPSPLPCPPTPPEPATDEAGIDEPWMDKPGTLIAAERALWQWELVEKLELAHCGGPARCPHACCRRSRLCAKAEELKPLITAARTTVAREQAKWKR
jgi:hypothetical protein